MASFRKISWPRIFAEGIAIVVSILLAFWIQAWWETRGERIEEVEVLSLLRDEVQSFPDTLVNLDNYNAAILDSARRLLVAASDEEVELSQSEMDVLLYDLTWVQEPSALDLPVYFSLSQSGRLEVISNNEVRRRLDRWDAKIQTLRDDYVRDLDFVDNYQTPYFMRHLSVPQILGASQTVPGYPSSSFSGYGLKWPSKIDHRPLLGEREFQNVIQERMNRLHEIVEWRPAGIDTDTAEILQIIENELQKLQ